MPIEFLDEAWTEYIDWQNEDRKTLKRINNLIKSIQRDGLRNGIGKPERLSIKTAGQEESIVKID